MSSTTLRIGIAGCGPVARVHLERLLALNEVEIVGCSDPDIHAAEMLSARLPNRQDESRISFSDHRLLIQQYSPDAMAIFTPPLAHYRPAMDALQADCHVFIEEPLSTNLQEAVDIVGLARGRCRKVGVGQQYRLNPGLIEAKRLLAEGRIGPLRLIVATVTRASVAWSDPGSDESREIDQNFSGGGVLTEFGVHLLDALLWTTGQEAVKAAAFQTRLVSGIDVVTAALIRLADQTPVTLAISGTASTGLFELNYFGEDGRLRATDHSLELETSRTPLTRLPLPEAVGSIDGNFVAAVLSGSLLCCPAEEAIATVRLLEALARSATTGEVVDLT